MYHEIYNFLNHMELAQRDLDEVSMQASLEMRYFKSQFLYIFRILFHI